MTTSTLHRNVDALHPATSRNSSRGEDSESPEQLEAVTTQWQRLSTRSSAATASGAASWKTALALLLAAHFIPAAAPIVPQVQGLEIVNPNVSWFGHNSTNSLPSGGGSLGVMSAADLRDDEARPWRGEVIPMRDEKLLFTAAVEFRVSDLPLLPIYVDVDLRRLERDE